MSSIKLILPSISPYKITKQKLMWKSINTLGAKKSWAMDTYVWSSSTGARSMYQDVYMCDFRELLMSLYMPWIGFLNPNTIYTLNYIILCCEGWSMHYRALISISGLFQINAHSTTFTPSSDNQRHPQTFPNISLEWSEDQTSFGSLQCYNCDLEIVQGERRKFIQVLISVMCLALGQRSPNFPSIVLPSKPVYHTVCSSAVTCNQMAQKQL